MNDSQSDDDAKDNTMVEDLFNKNGREFIADLQQPYQSHGQFNEDDEDNFTSPAIQKKFQKSMATQ